MGNIKEVCLSDIDHFPNHPFKVIKDEDFIRLTESIRDVGLITPAIVRLKKNGRYELIAGHRRKLACELAGIPTMRCEIVELSDDDAVILMVESNFQRTNILPSEKAFAYKMRIEAMRRKAGRTKEKNLVPLGLHSSREILSSETGESQTQIHRYIRLTELVPELLEYVDAGKIKMRPAVELSYLDEEAQRDLVDEIDMNEITPSYSQAIKMKKEFQEGNLTREQISIIMSERKANQEDKLVFRSSTIKKLLPESVPSSQAEDYICKALEFYNRYLKNQMHKYKGRGK